ncbi:DNA repair and recombination protein pif1 [Trichophyton tonsurans CBS 112818]|uniref:ATP-dependent DNA helicase PIF1 n=1 Tax=Trichophyton tonsurans (strain CBS 112818) TaxID=647933 RepID=F2S1K4_TRIT1|nr:DNA repair and recombination protein pif1 [Trichophyton tonsurans CBS 112818]
MFTRAVQEHPERQKKPNALQPNRDRLNSTLQSRNLQSSSQRKADFTSELSRSALDDLHDAVYFGGNDSENEEFLEIAYQISKPTQSKSASHNSSIADANSRKNDSSAPTEAMPSSSFPIPWSSSPPREQEHPNPPHQQPKKRTLPWDDAMQDNRGKFGPSSDYPITNRNTSFKKPMLKSRDVQPTPQLTRLDDQTVKAEQIPVKKKHMPWDKTFSDVKEEQKELRKQMKSKSLAASEKRLNNVQRPSNTRVPSIFFSEEQNQVIETIVRKGKSVFYTGSAGTGKSVLMREIIRQLRLKYSRDTDAVAVTASTGLAACNIEGVTLHSFAGVGLGKESTQELVKRNLKAKNRWLKTKVLIIDEISMVDGDFFDKLEELARKIRNNGRPFGGIQLVTTGDFFQLPPVPEGGKEAKFAFAAGTWNTSIQHTILLTQVFRQRDPDFANMLNEMRLGRLSPSAIQAFKDLSRPLNCGDNIEATELFPTRAEVDRANSERMNRLSGSVMTFHAADSGAIKDEQFRAKLLSIAWHQLLFISKRGPGTVIAFMDEAGFDNHVKEGLKRENGYYDFDEPSQAKQKIKSMAFDQKTNTGSINTSRQYPLVAFILPDGSERQLLCMPEAWKIELPNGEVQAQRLQIPLILAWALSIHKAQGQTLQRVKVDLGRVFERGQAYVALSRATSKDGLQVSRFDPKKVMVHPKVTEFYQNLSSISDINSGRKSRVVVDGNHSDVEDDFDSIAQYDFNDKIISECIQYAHR